MTARLILPLFAFGTLALAGVPTPVSLVWFQVAFVPPGTNPTVRTDIIGGAVVGVAGPPAPQGGTAVAPGGAGASVGVPVPGGVIAPGRTGPPVPAGSSSSSATAPRTANSAPAPSVALDSPTCTATVAAGEYPVSAFGGIIELKVQLKPAGCKPVLGSSGSWILLAGGPQQADVYRFAVAPNLSNAPRTGVVVLGSQKILIQQAASVGARFSASPGHLALSVIGDKAPSTRTLTVVSDDKSIAYTVAVGQPWLSVTPAAKGSTPGAQRYQVKVDPSKLRAGRNEGFVRFSATGQASPPLTVPVVVEVPKPR